MGAAMLVRREAIDEVGPLDESFFLFSEEVDWCYRFEQAGWKVLLHARGGGRPRRRRLARRAAVRPAGARPRPLPRQAPRARLRRAGPEAARRLAAAARAALPRRARGDVPARARASSPPAAPRRSCDEGPARHRRRRARRCSRSPASCPPPGSASTCGSRRRRASCCCPAAGRGRGHVRDARPWSLGAVAVALAVTFAVHGSLDPRARAARGAHARARRLEPPARGAAGRGRGARARRRGTLRDRALARAGHGARRRALPPRARAEAGGARRPLAAQRRRVQGRRAPSRATRSRSGTACSRSSRGSRASTRPWSSATRRACSARSRSLVGYEAGKALFRDSWLAADRARRLARAVRARAGVRRSVEVARPAGDRGAATSSCRRCSRSSSRRRRAFGYATLAVLSLDLALVHPTYAPFLLVPLAGYLAARALLGGHADVPAIAGSLAAVRVPTAAMLVWLLPIVRETASPDPSGSGLTGSRHGIAGTPTSSTCSRRRASGSGPRCSTGAARSRSRRSCSSRSRRSPGGGAGPRSCSAARSPCSRSYSCPSSSRISQAQSRCRRRAASPASSRCRSRSRAAPGCSRRCCACGRSRSRSPRESGSSSPGRGTSATRWSHGGPALATWIAAVGGLAALVAAAVIRRWDLRGGSTRLAALAAGLFLLPVAVHGLGHWHRPAPESSLELTPGLVDALRARGAEARGRLLRPRDELPDRRRTPRSTSPPRRRRTSPTRRRTTPTGARPM